MKDVIGTMPRLRSGLSRADSWSTWRDTVVDAIRLISDNASCVPKQHQDSFRAILSKCINTFRSGTVLERVSNSGTGISKFCPEELSEWIVDQRLRRLSNHETRGHMPKDLARYMFSAAFGLATKRSPKALRISLLRWPLTTETGRAESFQIDFEFN